jgi:hypothetical protein
MTWLAQLVLSLAANLPMSQTIEFAPLSGQGLDSTIVQSDPDTAFGPSVALSVARSEFGHYRTIIGFDLSGAMYGQDGIPAGSKIISATLRLNCSSAAPAASSCSVHLLKSGVEVVSLETTWNSQHTGVPWIVPGGDYERTASATFLAPIVEGFFDISGLVNAVQDALDDNDRVCNLILRYSTEDTSNQAWNVASSETPYQPISDRPRLIVVYLPAAAGATPVADPPDDAEENRDVATTAGWVDLPIGDARSHQATQTPDP